MNLLYLSKSFRSKETYFEGESHLIRNFTLFHNFFNKYYWDPIENIHALNLISIFQWITKYKMKFNFSGINEIVLSYLVFVR